MPPTRSIDALDRLTVEDVFEQFVAGDDALRSSFSAWLDAEPHLSPASFSADLATSVSAHLDLLRKTPTVAVYRVLAVRPGHWTAKDVSVGRHWSLSRDLAAVMAPRPSDAREYLLAAEIDLADAALVDWPATVAAHIAYQHQEGEIVLREGRMVRLLSVEDLADGSRVAAPPSVSTDGLRRPAKAFFPMVHGKPNARRYDDGRVQGDVEETPSGLTIRDWESLDPGKGHTVEALTWLRTRYGAIRVVGIGEIDEDGVGDVSVAYWEHMREKGLVDVLILDDGTELPSPGDPKP